MRLTDAKKILSGEYESYKGTQEICLVKGGTDHQNPDNWRYLDLTKKDFDFCLRQLALKVTREKEK